MKLFYLAAITLYFSSGTYANPQWGGEEENNEVTEEGGWGPPPPPPPPRRPVPVCRERVDLSYKKPVCTPGQTIKRREWRSMNFQEQQKFLDGILQLQYKCGRQRISFYDRLVYYHGYQAEKVHSVANFLPFHRWLLHIFERELRTVDKNLFIPYWSWELDSQAPEKAPIWDRATFGLNGDPSKGFCVTTGLFATWDPAYDGDLKRGHSRSCLTREWDQGTRISSFVSVEVVNALIARSASYDEFRQGLEVTPHGTVHNNIGGHMLTMFSPNDPIFWLHHGNIDKIWKDYQNFKRTNVMAYGGRNFDGTIANLEQMIPVFSGVKVRHAMTTEALCYEYVPLTKEAVAAAAVKLPPATVRSPPSPPPRVQNEWQEETDEWGQPVAANEWGRPAVNEWEQPAANQWGRPAANQWRQPVANQWGGDEWGGGWRRLFRRNAPPATPATGAKPAAPTVPTVIKAVDHEAKVQTADAKLAADDRSELTKLRTTVPLPEAWLKKNGFNVESAAKIQIVANNITKTLNKLEGFVSESSLMRQTDLVRKLQADGQKTFQATVNNQKVVVTSTSKDPGQATANILARVEKSIPPDTLSKPITEIAAKVAAVVGLPATHGVSNPFQTHKQGEKPVDKEALKQEVKPVTLKAELQKVTPAEVKKQEAKAVKAVEKREEIKQQAVVNATNGINPFAANKTTDGKAPAPATVPLKTGPIAPPVQGPPAPPAKPATPTVNAPPARA